MPKPSVGYGEALRPTAIILPPNLRLPLLWACSARWMRREPLRRPDLRSTQALPSAAFAPPNRVTIRRSLLGRSACARACAWQECRRGDDVSVGSFSTPGEPLPPTI